MQTHNLGYPRIGTRRELKKSLENYWSGKESLEDLLSTGSRIRLRNWEVQRDEGLDLLPCNDFSFYDHVLDTSMMFGAIPGRFRTLSSELSLGETELMFAMARGYQRDGHNVSPLEMTKWFDTNYHYLVPEFRKDQEFLLNTGKLTGEFRQARSAGFRVKPVLLGPVSYLLLGKEKQPGFQRLSLLDRLLECYLEALEALDKEGATHIQLDEPFLAMDLDSAEQKAFLHAYESIRSHFPRLHLMIAAYFEGYGDNLPTALSLPADTLHLDLVRCPSLLDDILESALLRPEMQLSLGLVDGRNIWKNDYQYSLSLIRKALNKLGAERLWLAPSCSLLHAPCDLELEREEDFKDTGVLGWMAFARQKIREVVDLAALGAGSSDTSLRKKLEENVLAHQERRQAPLLRDPAVRKKLQATRKEDAERRSPFAVRKGLQQDMFKLPLFPVTTIGSFPQTAEVRSWRAGLKKGLMSAKDYDSLIEREIASLIRWQEEAGMDVLVHGEFERNDMVEYFGEQLNGFAFTRNGWVQSYGSRCVKPPVIYGDVSRPTPMTLKWTCYAQSLTEKPVKGMLTGPVTMLQWSFVRNDQPLSETCLQIALAIRDEVLDLEKAGISIIQVDEPALREGLPLRREKREEYLRWAVQAFKLASCGVADHTQIHTHMCYAEFHDIIEHIVRMDADVITLECSRSQMELLESFASFYYPNDMGPGVYDIHSPMVPSRNEMRRLLTKALKVVAPGQLWVNPDCGLKTRNWGETRLALIEMIAAAKALREEIQASA